ncbi:MAG: hypothetical protein K8F52_10015 [Candidatus Scalindua rubra]|uniref:Thymidylate kinase n=1 Tax=Candidatus Scalindua brodae TaxID=237368 RepID=A0A0B0ETM1_9BACT|nr:MAG: hypothetical protein SCABRO_00219 [Candidatus Scalindua brodae]MBZ0108994.1 hypothetical protein [Candidatus Scalindua rubra]
MIDLVKQLIKALNDNKVCYCHWKSNQNIERALNAKEDIDLLVVSGAVGDFHACLIALGFKAANQPAREESYSIRHYYGLDYATGTLVHIHIHYRLVTGGSALKNYRFNVENMLMQHMEQISGVNVPSKAAELLMLVVRKTLESASITEMIMLLRERNVVREEIEWLLQDEQNVIHGVNGVIDLLEKWFPGINKKLFFYALENLRGQWNILKLFVIGNIMVLALQQYAIFSMMSGCCLRGWRFSCKIVKRMAVKQRTHSFITGGTIIAVVGADATGKSTIVKMLTDWLSEHFKTSTYHVGRPPSSFTTWFPNKLMPFLRKIIPRFRSGNIEAEIQDKGGDTLKGVRLLVFIVRSLLIAHDRTRILTKIYRQATRGTIVICDRYPTPIVGAMDSCQVDNKLQAVRSNRFFSFLAKREDNMYRKMSPPDVVFKLSVPVETAIKRNEMRIKDGVEDNSWVRRRHIQSELQDYPRSITFNIDTDKGMEETLLEIKCCVWSVL